MAGMTAEKKVGLMVLASVVCVLATVMFVGKARFGFYSGRIKVSFDFVDSLKRDAPVLYGGGVKIGVVDNIELAANKVLVTCYLKSGTRIPKDSVITINTSGILGEKYVQIDAGTGEEGYLNDGDQVIGVDPGSLDRALQRIEKLSDFLSGVFSNDALKHNLVETLQKSGRLAGELADLVHHSRGDIEHTLANLREASENVDASSKDAKGVVDNAKAMLSDKNRQNMEKSLELLRSNLDKLDTALTAMNDKKSVLGVLATDEGAGSDLRELIEDLKAHPWKLLWKK